MKTYRKESSSGAPSLDEPAVCSYATVCRDEMNFGPLQAISAALVLLVAQRCRIWPFEGEGWWPQARDSATRSEAGIADHQRALVRIREIMEDPELYYDYQGGHGDEDGNDRGGNLRWIWSAASTVPRDVLLAAERPPHLRLVVTVRDISAMLHSMDRFLGHYGELGMTPDRMVFDIRRTATVDEAGRAGEAEVYRRLVGVISNMGADYSTSYADADEGSPSRAEIDYVSLLAAMRWLPLNDWILVVRGAELVSVDGTHSQRKSKEAAIWEFFDGLERDGFNSAWAKARDAAGSRGDAERLVAVRGYLRPDPGMRRAMNIEEAEKMFHGSFYLSYSPYFRFWELYKSPSVVGNVYLYKASPTYGDDERTNAIVLAADTIVEGRFGDVWEKPQDDDEKRAAAMRKSSSNRSHDGPC